MKSSAISSAKTLRGSLLAALLLIAATHAPAALISHSVGFDITGETRGDSPRLDFNAVLPLFDPALGTLNQVDLIYDFDLSLNLSISNRTLDPVPFTIPANRLNIEGPRFFDRFNFNNIVAALAIDETDYIVPAGTQRTIGSITLTLPGRLSEQYDIDSRLSRTSRPLLIRDIVLRPQGDVTPFIGPGATTLEFAALTTGPLGLPNSGGILSGVRSSTSFTLAGTVDVTYDFTPVPSPVPVPAALPLFLSGLFGIGFLARKRRREAARS